MKKPLFILLLLTMYSCSAITGEKNEKPTAELSISPKEARDATGIRFQLSAEDPDNADSYQLEIAYQHDFEIIEQESPIDKTITISENAEIIATVGNSDFDNTVRDSVHIYPVGSSQQILDNGASEDVETADIDMDGNIDIVATGGDPGENVIWFKNQGNGSFGEAIIISGEAKAGADIATGDIDNDGDIDVATASYWNDEEGKIAWYENDGNGNFGPQQIIEENLLRPQAVAIADMDQDGYVDVLGGISKGDNARVVWYKNNGDNTFTANIIADYATYAVHTPDLDQDGDPDLVTTTYKPLGAFFQVYENDGNGNLTTTYSDGVSTLWDVDFGDIDADGDLDIVTVSDVDVSNPYYNMGNMNFELRRFDAGGRTVGGRDLVIADMDGDEDLDIVYANHRDSKLIWRKNYLEEYGVEAGFSPTRVIPSNMEGPISAAGGDFDGDGDTDLVIGEELQGNIYTFEN
jgi:hypothetical protein